MKPLRATPGRRPVLSMTFSTCRASSPANGRVIVGLDRDGAEARLTVRDDGCGIKPEFLPHVFDRFRQADSSYTRQHGGLGLGLAIVRHLVEMHGGTVTAASEGESRGATFMVRLPL